VLIGEDQCSRILFGIRVQIDQNGPFHSSSSLRQRQRSDDQMSQRQGAELFNGTILSKSIFTSDSNGAQHLLLNPKKPGKLPGL